MNNSLYHDIRPRVVVWLALASLFSVLIITSTRPHLSVARAGLNSTVIPGGTIATNTTWDLAGSPYIVQGNLTVADGVNLNIQAGVEVRFAGNFYINVDGVLDVQGSPGQAVVFTSDQASPAPGDWQNLRIPLAGGTITLTYCEIRYAGHSGRPAVDLQDAGSLDISNCHIHDNAAEGVNLGGNGNTPILTNVEIDHNAEEAIYQESIDGQPAFTNLNLHDNGVNAVYIDNAHLDLIDVNLDGSPRALNGSPFLVRQLEVDAGRTLTITPGTTVQVMKASANNWIAVYSGALIAEGTSTLPVTFTSDQAAPQPGDWYAFNIQDGSVVRLAYCTIQYAGSASGIYQVRQFGNGYLQMQRCNVKDGSNGGIDISGAGAAPLIENVEIAFNSGPAIHQNNINKTPTYRGLNLHDNSVNAVLIDGGTLSAGLSATYDGVGAPLLFNASPTVASGASLTFGAGTEARFAKSIVLNIFGAFYATGNVSSPVIFTPQSGAAGGWAGIDIESGGKAQFSHCIIEKAGYNGNPMIDVFSPDVSFESCQITGSSDDGIHVDIAGGLPSFKFNDISGNTYGMRNTGPLVIDARNNYWGHPSGPFHPTSNPAGQGNQVSDKVLFDPWLTNPNSVPLYINPDHGGDTGKTTVYAYGMSFANGASLTLKRSGQADIQALVRGVRPDGSLEATLYLKSATLGAWDVEITDGNGNTMTLPGGFTVETGQSPQPWSDVSGRTKVLVNRDFSYFLMYGNSANIDAPAMQIWVEIPPDVEVTLPSDSPFLRLFFAQTNKNVLLFTAARVPGGSVDSYPFKLKSLQLGNREIIIRHGLPAFPGDYFNSAPDPNFATQVTSINVSITDIDATIHISTSTFSGDMQYKFHSQSAVSSMPLNITTSNLGNDVIYKYEGTIQDPASGLLYLSSEVKLPQALAQSLNQSMPQLLSAMTVAIIDPQVEQQALLGLNFEGVKSGISAPPPELASVNPQAAQNTKGLIQKANLQLPAALIARQSVTDAQLLRRLELLDQLVNQVVEESIAGLSPNPSTPIVTPQQVQDQSEDAFNMAMGYNEVMDDFADKRLFATKKYQAVNSFDPNDKVGPTGAGSQQYITGLEPLTYTISFENMASATAPAQEVFITDLLDDSVLDLSTVKLWQVSFGSHLINNSGGGLPFYKEVDLRPSQNLIVRISASLDSASGELKVIFTSIDPATGQLIEDPFGGFLPPNTDGSGAGSVLLTVMPLPGLASGTEIRNQASIVFDLNPAIETPEWLNTIDNTAPVCQVTPLAPTQTATPFQVSWGGSDAGSGIEHYSIYVSINNGPFQPWVLNTALTSFNYQAIYKGNYAFTCIASDQAGNREPGPAVGETQTSVNFLSNLFIPIVKR